MEYLELAEELLKVTHPKGKRPPLHRMGDYDHMKDMTLRYLYENGGETTPRELADAFDISSARVTKVLSDLEAEELASREGDIRDRRRIIVRLTETGRQQMEARQVMVREHVARVLEALGPEDAPELVRLMGRLISVLEEQGNPCCAVAKRRSPLWKGNNDAENSEITEKPQGRGFSGPVPAGGTGGV